MRKYFEGHSVIGVALILSSFFLAVFFRIYNLENQSPWTDELASWWYAQNLGEVFTRESHSPLYYFLLSPFVHSQTDIYTLRVFSVGISVIHLIECYFLGQDVFDRKKFILFWILICLNPVDIIYARMARHYAWLLEGILIFYLLWRRKSPDWLLALVASFMGFIHVFSVIPIFCILVFDYMKNGLRKGQFIIAGLSSLVIFYYLLRILILGQEAVKANVSWNSLTMFSFWTSVLTQFLGDSYPRYLFFPVNPYLAFTVVGASSLFILFKRKPSGLLYFGVLFVSFVAIEGLSFWINLRTNRYIIYLVAFWIVAIVDTFEDISDWKLLSVISLLAVFLVMNNPTSVYPWEREKVQAWRDFRKNLPEAQDLVCANSYQSSYYALNAPVLCREHVFGLNDKKPILFFDLNNNDRLVGLYLLKKMTASKVVPLENGFLAYFVPVTSRHTRIKNEK